MVYRFSLYLTWLSVEGRENTSRATNLMQLSIQLKYFDFNPNIHELY
jgi:hypothetical protein